MDFLKALTLLILIPIFGFIVSTWILSDINKDVAANGTNLTVSQLCQPAVLLEAPELKPMCDGIAPIQWLRTASIISVIAAVVLLLSFIAVASFAGSNRTKIAKVFPPLVLVTLVVLAVMVVVQGIIFTYGAYIAQSYAIQRVYYIVIGVIGLSALIGGISLIGSSITMAKKQVHSVLGKKLELDKHPQIFALIKEVSETLGSRSPEHVVVGLEPNFYVTSADVNILGSDTTLEGETLYLSLPLARILTLEEIKGIIGHELGHFRGADTYYSLKFSPVYSGLSHAVDAMGTGEEGVGLGSIATMPAHAVLSYIIDVFHKNVSTVSREREFEADKAACEVASPEALASSLLKIGLYAGAWNELIQRVVNRMQQGKATKNLSRLFSSIVKYDVNEDTIPKIIDEIANQTISHPTDSHPPTAVRISQMGLNIDDIERDLLKFPESNCINLFDSPIEIEQELTTLQQQYFIALGVEVPDEVTTDASTTVLAAFGAHMVLADGVVEAKEIDEAETIGMAMNPEFDFIEFREYCLHPESIPSLEDLLEAVKEVPADAKAAIVEYLEKISASDNDVSEGELKLLQVVRESFENDSAKPKLEE